MIFPPLFLRLGTQRLEAVIMRSRIRVHLHCMRRHLIFFLLAVVAYAVNGQQLSNGPVTLRGNEQIRSTQNHWPLWLCD